LTLIFKDEKTAKRARKKFQEIIDSSTQFSPIPPRLVFQLPMKPAARLAPSSPRYGRPPTGVSKEIERAPVREPEPL